MILIQLGKYLRPTGRPLSQHMLFYVFVFSQKALCLGAKGSWGQVYRAQDLGHLKFDSCYTQR